MIKRCLPEAEWIAEYGHQQVPVFQVREEEDTVPGAVLLPRPPLPETLRGTTLPTGRLADTGETPRGKGAIQRGGGEGRATPAPAARPWAAVASPLPALALQTLGMSSAGRGEPRRVSLGARGPQP